MSQLCQHNFEHTKMAKAWSNAYNVSMTGKLSVQSTLACLTLSSSVISIADHTYVILSMIGLILEHCSKA